MPTKVTSKVLEDVGMDPTCDLFFGNSVWVAP